ncbi:MAG: phage holin family protein [Actinomycetota bacterium]
MKLPSRRQQVIRVALIGVAQALALLLLAWILPGMAIDSLGGAIVAVALIALLNALLYPLLVRLTLKLALFTGGLFALVLNGAIVVAVSNFDQGLAVDGIATGIIAAFVLTIAASATTAIAGLDDEGTYYLTVIRRRARRRAPADVGDGRGLFFLEIDGLAADVLRRAIESGHVPTIATWLQSGSHRLVEWECDLSSQTGASQAGLLHGTNEGMPAFRWYERDSGRTMVSNHLDDAAEIERRVSDGNGLLCEGGGSRGNLLSGDAAYTAFTLSSLRGDLRRERAIDYDSFFADPYSFTRTLMLVTLDVLAEKRALWRARLGRVQPRLKRGGSYPLLRASTTVVLRDLAVYALIGDLFAGVPCAYATFVGYDEVAHHSGSEAPDALKVLERLDHQFGHIARAASLADRDYDLVVLSDHGQSNGATFKQRYGETLEELVRGLSEPGMSVDAAAEEDEGWAHLNAALTDELRDSRGLSRLASRRMEDGEMALGPGEEEPPAGAEAPELLVMASGNLGLVYFTESKHRLTREEIDARCPRLLAGVAGHEGVGWVMVRSGDGGAIVLGGAGERRLDGAGGGQLEGEDPLAHFGPNAARHLLRNHAFEHCPDLLVGSLYDPSTGEVAAFEELIGSHGGIGGTQSHPFVLAPAGYPVPDQPLVGAAAVHRMFKGWLAQGPGVGLN